MTETFRSQYVEVNGITMHCVSSGEGGMMLFLHGFPEFWAAWENQLTAFGKNHHAVAVDMRGYNLSSKPSGVEAYRMANLTEDLRALMDQCGEDRCILVGHDWGGSVAWNFAMRHPQRVERLVVINSPHPVMFARRLLNDPDQQRASRYMLKFRSPEAEEILSQNGFAQLIDTISGWGGNWEVPAAMRHRYIDAWSQPGALTGGLNYYRASPLFPPESEVDIKRIRKFLNMPQEMFKVRVPTLVIWGERDRALLTGNLEGMTDCVEHLTVERIPDASHWVVHEQPETVNGLIRRFIGEMTQPMSQSGLRDALKRKSAAKKLSQNAFLPGRRLGNP